MPVRQSAAGASYPPRTIRVSPRMALAYAACMGLTDRRYTDDAGPEFHPAPTWCVAAEWLLSGDPLNRSGLGLTDEERARAVHAGQDTRFFARIPIDQDLVVSGCIEDVRATRAGARLTSRFQIHSADKGTLLTDSLVETIFRGVSTDSPPADPAATPPPLSEKASVAQMALPAGFAHIYTECASIWNPIHTERRAALAAGLPDIIVHGTALWAMAFVRLDRPGLRLSRLAGRFSAMVRPGESVRLRHEGEHRTGIRFDLLNQSGDTAVSRGFIQFSEEE